MVRTLALGALLVLSGVTLGCSRNRCCPGAAPTAATSQAAPSGGASCGGMGKSCGSACGTGGKSCGK